MSQLRRYAYGASMTVAMAFAAVLYFRMFIDHLKPIVEEHQGPFDPVLEVLTWIPPMAIGIILFATWVWVLSSPVQQERARARGGPPR
ncbi:MAG: hypothetical protein ABEI98_02490 [Halorhabdus sp.]